MPDKNVIEPLAYSPNNAAIRLGISTRAVYMQISCGALVSFKLGKRRLITDKELKRFLDKKMTESPT